MKSEVRINSMSIFKEKILFNRSKSELKENIVEVLVEEIDEVLVLLKIFKVESKGSLFSMV